MINPTEALADAIMQFEGWHPPNAAFAGSRSWRNRNPGNLRPFAVAQAHDGDNYRVFNSLADGWIALLTDLEVKMEGQSKHKLTPQSTMLDLLNVYAPAGDANNPTTYTEFICAHTSLVLGRTITPTTTLAEFLG